MKWIISLCCVAALVGVGSGRTPANQELTSVSAYQAWKEKNIDGAGVAEHQAITVVARRNSAEEGAAQVALFEEGTAGLHSLKTISVMVQPVIASSGPDGKEVGERSRLTLAPREAASTGTTPLNESVLDVTMKFRAEASANALKIVVSTPDNPGYPPEWTMIVHLMEKAQPTTLAVLSNSPQSGKVGVQFKRAGYTRALPLECRTIVLDCVGCYLSKRCQTTSPIVSSCTGCYIDCTVC
jgi:hypothetical protein